MKFAKFWVVLALFLTVFTGCEDEKVQINEANESVPFDVPISQVDANVTIDEKLPPEPAIEGEEKSGIQIGSGQNAQ